MCLLTHPEDIEDVLVTNASNFVKSRNYRVLKLVLGNGLLTSEGAFWQRQRKLARPSFRHDSIARYAEVMVDSAWHMLHGWRDGQTRDARARRLRRESGAGTKASHCVAMPRQPSTTATQHIDARFRHGPNQCDVELLAPVPT
jgi:Cytochrome P450